MYILGSISAKLSYIMAFCSVFTNILAAQPHADHKPLDDYILHYEELNYNQDLLHEKHMRHKRSLDSAVHMTLNAFNKKFKLKLMHDPSVFAPNFVLEFNGTSSKPDLSFLYSGEVIDQPGSIVHGAIIHGLFRGTISIPNEHETYHVEKSNRFFNDQPVYHSVIYKESDMNLDPFREKRKRDRREAQELGTCGYANAMKWMKEVVQSEVVTDNREKRSESQWQEIHGESRAGRYSMETNSQEGHHRERRQSLDDANSGKDTCFLSLMSDVLLWQHYLEKAGNNVLVAKDEILAFFASHVNAIKKIYYYTNFTTYDGKTTFTGITFSVQKTKVMTTEDCLLGSSSPLYNFCQQNIDVSNFLNLNSLINHDEFCLAYVFTYRDFSAGTLGLAWVGAANSASGGVCERNKRFTEGSSQVAKSLNTGIVTTINYGKEVPSKVSQLTFAHEVGHNFGSPHDTGDVCAPYGSPRSDASQGNYIMFASATMGDKAHNDQFSPCSMDNITRVLEAVLYQPLKKYNCFQNSGPFCGNGIVEDGEDCDCGFYGDCKDHCCFAKNHPNIEKSKYCKLSSESSCSPSKGPCCNGTTCSFTVGTNIVCRYKTQCAKDAYCNGTSALCPPSETEPDGSYCNNYGFTCKKGECAGSLCEHFNWTECFVTGKSDTKDEQQRLCKLGCKQTAIDKDCILSDDPKIKKNQSYALYSEMIDEVKEKRTGYSSSTDGVQLAPGSPCNNFQGYCDVFHRCRGVDAEGPLARLKNLIFNPETLKDISNWIVEHWWAVLLMCIGLVIAMGLFIKFCAVHTPSSNPKAKPAKKLSDTLRRRHRNHNRQPPEQSHVVRYPQGKYEKPIADRDIRYQYVSNPQGPPPPYPGSSTSAAGSHLGPPHGHGKKGKNKHNQMEMGII